MPVIKQNPLASSGSINCPYCGLAFDAPQLFEMYEPLVPLIVNVMRCTCGHLFEVVRHVEVRYELHGAVESTPHRLGGVPNVASE